MADILYLIIDNMSLQSKSLYLKRLDLEESCKNLLDKHPDFSYHYVLNLIRTGQISKPEEYSDERYAANLYSIKLLKKVNE